MYHAQDENVVSVCSRLRAERERLRLSQAVFAATAEVAVKTVARWEKEIAVPADRLEKLTFVGVDAMYVVTGEASAATLSADETKLLEIYRAASPAVKAAAVAALAAGTTAEKGRTRSGQVFHGSVGQAVYVNEGGLTQGNVGIFGRQGEKENE